MIITTAPEQIPAIRGTLSLSSSSFSLALAGEDDVFVVAVVVDVAVGDPFKNILLSKFVTKTESLNEIA